MTYVSARFAQADPGIVSGSTIERKKMSTKTIYKRIALVAVAALGAGVLSVAPANAAEVDAVEFKSSGSVPALTESVLTNNKRTAAAKQTQVAGANNFVTIKTGGANGVLTITGSTLNTAATSGVSISADKLSATQTGAITYTVPTKTTGTITVNFYATDGSNVTSTSITDQLVISVINAADKLPSVANSTSIIYATTLPNPAVDEKISAEGVGNTGKVAEILVTIKDGTAAKTAINDVDLVAVVSGPGLFTSGAAKARVALATTAGVGALAGQATFEIHADGTAGKSTITISAGTTVIATETLTFSGPATKYVAAVKKQHVPNSNAPTSDAVEITVTDKDGNLVPNATVLASVGTSTTATVTASATTDATGIAKFAVTGVTAKFGAVVITFADSATTPKVTTTATVGVSSPLAKTVTVKSDKATYAPGEKITWTMTFLDGNGLGIPDGTYAKDELLKDVATNPAASASIGTTPFLGTEEVKIVAGVATATGFAPLAAGPISYTWTIAGTTGAPDTTNLVTALQATTVTGTATVTESASMQAITTLINSLIAKINALNKLVIKIQKKVRA
jgi:protocatechuate 3,4-dioxygenase beta subunit